MKLAKLMGALAVIPAAMLLVFILCGAYLLGFPRRGYHFPN